MPVGWFFSSPVRIERLRALLQETKEVSLAFLIALQRDVTAAAALRTRDRLLGLLHRRDEPIAAALAAWDGAYEAGSAGALAHELLMFHTGCALLGKRVLRLYSAAFNARRLLAQDLEKLPDQRLTEVLDRVLPAASRRFRALRTWGAAHRLMLRHFLASFPLTGRRWRFCDWPANGGSDTLAKTANALTDRRHYSNLSSTARHISDLADPDANFFVLLGGQDGWIGSTTMLDQARMWRRGDYVQVPLRPETARATFPFTTELRP
jgi:penicillin amidase